jgi:serine protease Do
MVNDLRDDGVVQRGWLGVGLQQVDRAMAEALGVAEARGVLIASVEPGSPAARAGIMPGDIVTKAGERQVRTPGELAATVADANPGQSLSLTLRRQGEERQQQVTLGTPPDRRADAGARGGQAGQGTGALGLALAPRPSGQPGAVVARVAQGSVAEESGLRTGDVILRVGDVDVTNAGDVTTAVQAAREAGRPAVALQIERGNRRSFVALPIGGQQG